MSDFTTMYFCTYHIVFIKLNGHNDFTNILEKIIHWNYMYSIIVENQKSTMKILSWRHSFVNNRQINVADKVPAMTKKLYI